MSTETKKDRITRITRCYDELVAAAPEMAFGDLVDLLTAIDGFSPAYVKQVLKGLDRTPKGADAELNDRITARLASIGHLPAPPPRLGSYEAGGRSFVVVGDAHFGLTRHSRVAAVEAAIRGALDLLAGDVEVVLLGDTIHADTYRGETSKGTRLEVGRPPEEVIPEVVAMVRRLNVAGVPVRVFQGNHDMLGAIWLAAAAGVEVERASVGVGGHVGMYHGDKDLTRVYGQLRERGLTGVPRDATIIRAHNHVFDVTFDPARGTVVTVPAASPRSAYAEDEGYPEVPPAVLGVEFDDDGRLGLLELVYIEEAPP